MLLPVKLAIMLCVILTPLGANPSISSNEFPFVFEWKRLTGSVNNPVGWTDSLFLFSESDGHVVAVDRNTKLVRWRYSVGRGVKTLKILGSRLIYTDSFGTVGILKLEDGTVDWTDSETTGTTAIASSGDLIYINRSDGWLYAHHIDGLPAWQLRVGSGRPTIPLIHNDRIYVGTAMGGILVVDARSGERLQTEDVGIGVGSFVSAAGGLVAACSDGYLRAWQMADLSIVWERRLGAKVMNRLWVRKDVVVCTAGNKFVYGINAETGEFLWKRNIDAMPTSLVPLHESGKILVASESGRLHAFDWETGEVVWQQQIVNNKVQLVGDEHTLLATAADGYVYVFNCSHKSRPDSLFSNWYEIRSAGLKTGYSKQSFKQSVDGWLWRMESVSWSHGFVRTQSVIKVDNNFMPMSYQIQKIEGDQELTIRGKFLNDGRLISEQRLADQSTVDTLQIGRYVLFPEVVFQWLSSTGSLSPGVADTVAVFDYIDLVKRPLYVSVHDKVITGTDTLLKTTMRHGSIAQEPSEQSTDILSAIVINSWVYPDGSESRTEIPDFGSITTRVDRSTAISWEPPAKPKSLTLDHPIAKPNLMERMEIRLPPSIVSPEKLFISDNRQYLKSDSLGIRLVTCGLDVKLDSTLTIPIKQQNVRRYLEPSLYVQSQHARVCSLSARIINNNRNAVSVARQLLHWVYDYMVPLDTNVSFKSTLEVLDDMRGTCSEYTVLYVALCRAAGIPSRVSVGFAVSSSGELVLHIWPEIFLGQWIDVDPSWNSFQIKATHIKTGFDVLTRAGIRRLNVPLQLISASAEKFELIEYETPDGLFLSSAESLYHQAEKADRGFEEERAQELYHKIVLLKWNQRSVDAHVRIARYHLQHGRLEEAEWPLQRMLRIGTGDIMIAQGWFFLARIAAQRQRPLRAEKLYQQLVEVFPSSDLADDALAALADLQEERSGCRKARPHLLRLVEEYSLSGWAAVARAELENCRVKENQLNFLSPSRNP